MDRVCPECAEIVQEYREAVIEFWTNASDKKTPVMRTNENYYREEFGDGDP